VELNGTQHPWSTFIPQIHTKKDTETPSDCSKKVSLQASAEKTKCTRIIQTFPDWPPGA
jgi:hypothetical protein